jgi:hypothetical protein
VDEHTGVGKRAGKELRFQLKVPEVCGTDRTVVKKVGTRAIRGKLAINNLPGSCILTRLPAFETSAVEERNPAFTLSRSPQTSGPSHNGRKKRAP